MTAITITNHGFEAGDLTGWTTVAGSFVAATVDPFSSITPPVGSYAAFVNAAHAAPTLRQDIDLTATFSNAELDNSGTFSVSAYLRHTSTAGGDNDLAGLRARFLDGTSTPIGSAFEVTRSANSWAIESVGGTVPIGARFLRIELYGVRGTVGTTVNAGWDEVTADLDPGVVETLQVDSINPAVGAITGGLPVTISGTNFAGATGVLIGGEAATSVVVVNSTTITCVTPANEIGLADVTVQHADGDGTLAYGFEYVIATVESVTPDEGPTAGGTIVSIIGAGFDNIVGILFGSVSVPSFSVVDDNLIICDTPANSAGLTDITFDFLLDTLIVENAFTYFSARITLINPASGNTAGGTAVTITGEGFGDATGVLFGDDPATDFVVVDSETITCTTPAHGEIELVDVTIQHPDGDYTEPYGFSYENTQPRVTQIPINIVDIGARDARVTQIPINVVYVPVKAGRVTQIPINVAAPLEPVPPNALLPVWPILETWAWFTTVTKGLSGKEQRMASRREPFQEFEYVLALLDDEDRQTALYTLWRHTGRRLNYPMFVYSVPVLSPATIGESFLEAEVSLGNFRDGEAIAIFNWDLSIYEVVEATSVSLSPEGIVLAAPLEISVDTDLRIAPAPLCRIEDGRALTMQLNTGDLPVRFTADPTRELLRPGQSATLDTLAGLPIIDEKYIVEGVQEQLVRNLETLDTGVNIPVDFTTWRYPQINTFRAYLVEKEDLDYWREFGDTVKGSRGAFLVPSYRDDITLSAVPALSATILQTTETRVADFLASKSHRYLRIETANGVIYRQVREAVLRLDRVVQIVLATALGGTTGDNVITKISIVHKVRITDDVITLSHMPHFVTVSMNVSTVEE